MPGIDSPPKSADPDVRSCETAALIEVAEAEAARAEALAEAARARAQALRARGVQPLADAAVDEDADSSQDPSAQEPDGKRQRWRRPRRNTVVGGVGLLCALALLAASAVMVRQHQGVVRKQQLAAEYTAAARQVVATLMSIDPAKAKDDVQRILDSSTGQFRDEFKSAAEDFTKAAQSAKMATKTTVAAAAVQSMTPGSAVVLVAANSVLNAPSGPPQEPRSWRLSINLVREGGQIKMSSMEFVP